LFDKLAWNILAKGLNIYSGIRYQDAPSMLKHLEQLKELLGDETQGADDAGPPE
jgi:hypothetical protein